MSYDEHDDSDFEGDATCPKRFIHKELIDLIRDLKFSKKSSELRALQIKKKIFCFRNRKKDLQAFYSQEDNFCKKMVIYI